MYLACTIIYHLCLVVCDDRAWQCLFLGSRISADIGWCINVLDADGDKERGVLCSKKIHTSEVSYYSTSKLELQRVELGGIVSTHPAPVCSKYATCSSRLWLWLLRVMNEYVSGDYCFMRLFLSPSYHINKTVAAASTSSTAGQR